MKKNWTRKAETMSEEEIDRVGISKEYMTYAGSVQQAINNIPGYIEIINQAKAAIQLEAENQKLREENERLTLKIEKHNAVMQEFRKAFPGLCLFKFGQ